MLGVMIFFTGVGIGVVGTVAVLWPMVRPPFGWPSLPASTPRAIARVARRNRAYLRHLRPAREAGVRIPDEDQLRRLPKLSEPPMQRLYDIDAYDHEGTPS